VTDIAYLYFDNRITFAVTFNNEHHMISQSLDKTEQELDPALFFRANRQTIIHIEAVDHFESYFGGKLAVKLTNPSAEKVIISQAKAAAFKNWLNS
jgi:DNA-binding LytR/AlgR family response regulator